MIIKRNSTYDTTGKGPKPLGGFIMNTIKRLEAERKKNSSLAEAWRKNVSNDILEHTKVEGIRGNVLFVKVDSAIWLHNIVAFRKHELLQLMKESYKSKYISDIKFKIGIIREEA